MSKIKIREAQIDDCSSLAYIIISVTQYTFRGLVPDKCLDWLTPEESTANWARNFQPDGTPNPGFNLCVAETASKEVVGLALMMEMSPEDKYKTSIIEQYSYELRSLQVDSTWHRQGIGRLLVEHIAKKLQQENIESLLVRVLKENPNRGFYEHLGAVLIGSRPYNWEGYMTEEMIYGWSNLNKLASKE